MKTDNSKYKNNVFFVFLTFFLIVVIIACSCVWLASKDDNRGKYNIEPSNELIVRCASSVIINDKVEMNQDDINSLIAYIMDKKDFIIGKGIRVNSIFIDLSSEEISFYIPIEYKGKNFGVNLKCNVDLEKTNGVFRVKILKINIGRLPIPKKIFINIIKNKLPNSVVLSSDTLFFNSLIRFNIDGHIIGLKIKELEREEDKLQVKVVGNLNEIGNFLKDKVGEVLKDNEIGGNLLKGFNGIISRLINGY